MVPPFWFALLIHSMTSYNHCDLYSSSSHSTTPLPVDEMQLNTNKNLVVATVNVGQGLLNKLPSLLHWASNTEIDVVAIQETGLTRHDHALLNHYEYRMLLNSKPHAGVALLVRNRLSILSIADLSFGGAGVGRLVGTVLQGSSSKRLLLVSAYMPTGMDHCAMDHPLAKLCSSLYSKILDWSREHKVSHAIVMGT